MKSKRVFDGTCHVTVDVRNGAKCWAYLSLGPGDGVGEKLDRHSEFREELAPGRSEKVSVDEAQKVVSERFTLPMQSKASALPEPRF